MHNRETEQKLLVNIKTAMPELLKLQGECSDRLDNPGIETVGEDRVYRFYHQSFKVYWLQDITLNIIGQLRNLNPAGPGFKLNDLFEQIVSAGTGKKFEYTHNEDWPRHTRPIIEAFFHVRWALDMVIKYGGSLEEPPVVLPTGWAAVLTLYHLR
jgi:hypothetical protein